MALVIEAQSLAERDIPEYSSPDGTAEDHLHPRADARRGALSGPMEPNLVVEFYSR